MKTSSNFVLRRVAGECMLMPAGDNISTFRGVLLMNELSAFVWEKMQTPVSWDELLTAILDRYQIDEQTAASDLDGLLAKFRQLGVIEE